MINLPGSAINFIGGQFRYFHEEGGHEMHLICSPGSGIEEFCEANGVHYYPVELARQVSLKNDLKALRQIIRYIRANKIEMVIAHQSKARLLGMIASAICRVPYRITFAHGVVYETMHGLKRWLMIQNDRFVSLLADKVVCVSPYVIDFRKNDHIDLPGKRVLLGKGSCNGLDTINKFNPELVDDEVLTELKAKYGLHKEEFIIGFCGRLVRDKGVIELVEAFQKLKASHTERKLKLFVIGKPEKWDGLPQATLDYLESADDIVFTGYVPFAEIQSYYMLIDVLVLPTHREGFGMVSVEAAAMGVPGIVSGYTGSAATVENGVTGLYIDKSPESIVAAVEKMFNDNLRKQMGAAGRTYVHDNFEHKNVCRHMLDQINDLILK